MTDITKICLPWLHYPYEDPVTKRPIDIGTPRFVQLTEQCKELVSFDLLGLNVAPNGTINASPIASFLTVAFLGRYTQNLVHPYQKEYSAQTNIESTFIENFDFGFVWHYTPKGWRLEPPRNTKSHTKADAPEVILISIVHPEYISCNVLLHDGDEWERFAPLGTTRKNPELDYALTEYLMEHYKVKSYYVPLECPISNAAHPNKEVLCAVWELWFLMYRLMHHNVQWREKYYNDAKAEILEDRAHFHEFMDDYILFIQTERKLLTQKEIPRDHTADDFLSEEIFRVLNLK